MDVVYDILINHCENQIVEAKRDGKDTFVITQERFVRWMNADTHCCQATAKDKWNILASDEVIVPFGHKQRNAHVVVDTLLMMSGFSEKNKKIKIKIFDDHEYKGFVPVLKGVEDHD